MAFKKGFGNGPTPWYQLCAYCRTGIYHPIGSEWMHGYHAGGSRLIATMECTYCFTRELKFTSPDSNFMETAKNTFY